MKRIMTLVLAMLMCFGLLCACGEPTEEGNEGAPGTDSAKELMSKIHYTYIQERNGKTTESEYVIDIQWTENGAVVEGYQDDSEEGRYEKTMELTLDDQKRPVSMISKTTDPEGETEEYSVVLSYEKDRQIKQTVTYEEGNTRVTTYHFDENGRLILQETEGGTVRTYEYDAQGNQTLYRYENPNSESVAEYRTDYTYDDAGKAVFATYTNYSDDEQTQIHYYYYPNGNVMMEMKISNRGEVNFGFRPNNPKDTMGWGYGMSAGVGMNMEYTVETDANGYYTKIIRTNTQSGESQTATMEYDANGNLVKYTGFYGDTKQWEYDSQNRLVKYTYNEDVTEYAYDDQGRLVSEKRMEADEDNATQTRAYNEAGMTVKSMRSRVYAFDNGEETIEEIMEIEYTENANCSINNEWADFFLANLFDVT
ncbi:MAG: RHS repeat protein [Ruminococcaceae bacterium]|nr:RHS repeat protein [Oscillospiraceae bacterium]